MPKFRRSVKLYVYGIGIPTVGPTSYSIRLHIYMYMMCAIACIAEISLHVTLYNQSHSLTV